MPTIPRSRRCVRHPSSSPAPEQQEEEEACRPPGHRREQGLPVGEVTTRAEEPWSAAPAPMPRSGPQQTRGEGGARLGPVAVQGRAAASRPQADPPAAQPGCAVARTAVRRRPGEGGDRQDHHSAPRVQQHRHGRRGDHPAASSALATAGSGQARQLPRGGPEGGPGEPSAAAGWLPTDQAADEQPAESPERPRRSCTTRRPLAAYAAFVRARGWKATASTPCPRWPGGAGELAERRAPGQPGVPGR